MSNKQKTELAVIGAGPGGYAAAFHAADCGLSVTLIDPEENPGGVCLYRGCIPSKALLHAEAFLAECDRAPDWGFSLGEVSLDPDKLRAWKDQVVGKLTKGVGQLCKQRGIRYIQGRARFENSTTLDIEPVEGDPAQLSCDQTVVATGSLPATIPSAIDSHRVMTSRQALDIEDVPGTLLVIGAGYIGLELGQVYASLGARVTVVEMLSGILPGADRDLAWVLAKRLDVQFDSIRLETKVVGMEETKNGVKVRFEGKNAPEDDPVFEKIMLAVGRKPNTEDTGIENTSIELDDQGFIRVDDQRRTTDANLFAIGDVAGQPMLAHKATHEGRVAAEAAAGKKSAFDPAATPNVVFSNPEIAWCGLTETQAEEQGLSISMGRFPWSASGRAATLGLAGGLTKVIAERDSGRLLGLGIAGPNAGELIGQGVIAMEMGAVAEDLALAIQTHPTLSETLMEAAQGIVGKSMHYLGKEE